MVQNRALRYYLGVHRFTPLPALHGEFGWSLPHHRHCVNAVRYWKRLLSMDDNRINKIVFFWDMNQHNSSPWTSQMKSLRCPILRKCTTADFFIFIDNRHLVHHRDTVSRISCICSAQSDKIAISSAYISIFYLYSFIKNFYFFSKIINEKSKQCW